MTTKTCTWHRCGAEFTPSHGRQTFCSPECSRRMLEWRRMRGAGIVRMLMEDPDWKKKVADERARLQREIDLARSGKIG